jgi:hypothetical protein
MIKELSKVLLVLITLILFLFAVSLATEALAKPPSSAKSKFYDFNEQVIDGEIRKPTALYTDARQKAKFDRLLRLKKSFLPRLFKTSKNKVFK